MDWIQILGVNGKRAFHECPDSVDAVVSVDILVGLFSAFDFLRERNGMHGVFCPVQEINEFAHTRLFYIFDGKQCPSEPSLEFRFDDCADSGEKDN